MGWKYRAAVLQVLYPIHQCCRCWVLQIATCHTTIATCHTTIATCHTTIAMAQLQLLTRWLTGCAGSERFAEACHLVLFSDQILICEPVALTVPNPRYRRRSKSPKPKTITQVKYIVILASTIHGLHTSLISKRQTFKLSCLSGC